MFRAFFKLFLGVRVLVCGCVFSDFSGFCETKMHDDQVAKQISQPVYRKINKHDDKTEKVGDVVMTNYAASTESAEALAAPTQLVGFVTEALGSWLYNCFFLSNFGCTAVSSFVKSALDTFQCN